MAYRSGLETVEFIYFTVDGCVSDEMVDIIVLGGQFLLFRGERRGFGE